MASNRQILHRKSASRIRHLVGFSALIMLIFCTLVVYQGSQSYRNALSEDLRAKIISISLWVAKYSRQVTRDKAPVAPLIEINRNIMAGLQAS